MPDYGGVTGGEARVRSYDDSRGHVLASGSTGAAACGGAGGRGVGAGGAVALGGLLLGRRDEPRVGAAGVDRAAAGGGRGDPGPAAQRGAGRDGSRRAAPAVPRPGHGRRRARRAGLDGPGRRAGRLPGDPAWRVPGGTARPARRRAADGGRPLRQAGRRGARLAPADAPAAGVRGRWPAHPPVERPARRRRDPGLGRHRGPAARRPPGHRRGPGRRRSAGAAHHRPLPDDGDGPGRGRPARGAAAGRHRRRRRGRPRGGGGRPVLGSGRSGQGRTPPGTG
jgi:hypothetical protein